MTIPAERPFAIFKRGDLREEMLAYFRIALREKTNPDTGTAFEETEIATATAKGSYFYDRAEGLDLVLMTQQSAAQWWADQQRIDRSSDESLINYHGGLWGEEKLAATGGSGPVDAIATVGAIFVGSTTVPDPTATVGVDPAGLRYQVFTTVHTPAGGTAELTLVGIDTGTQTNIGTATIITWSDNAPLGAAATATATDNFTGGTDAETSAEFADRMAARVRHKPAGGNWSQFRSWGRESTNSVSDAFVYPCAFHAGSVLVCITQKRGDTEGPLGLQANAVTLGTVTAYLVPPGSPVVPERAFVLVTTFQEEAVDAEIQLSMATGTTSGWADATPWPGYTDGAGTVASITNLSSQTSFRIHSDTSLPTGVTQPQIMVWHETTSRWEKLVVTSVVAFGGNEYTVTLSQAQSPTVAVGDYVSPYTARAELIAETIEQYFDGLGPGEVIDLTTDTRAHRAMRFPRPTEEKPLRAGSAVGSSISEALGQNAADVVVAAMAPKTPTVPTAILDGPYKLVCGKMAIYSV